MYSSRVAYDGPASDEAAESARAALGELSLGGAGASVSSGFAGVGANGPSNPASVTIVTVNPSNEPFDRERERGPQTRVENVTVSSPHRSLSNSALASAAASAVPASQEPPPLRSTFSLGPENIVERFDSGSENASPGHHSSKNSAPPRFLLNSSTFPLLCAPLSVLVLNVHSFIKLLSTLRDTSAA